MDQETKQPLIAEVKVLIVTAVIAGVILVVLSSLWQRVDRWLELRESQTKAEAVQGCMEVSSYTFNNGLGVVTKEPIKESVEECLKSKGY